MSEKTSDPDVLTAFFWCVMFFGGLGVALFGSGGHSIAGAILVFNSVLWDVFDEWKKLQERTKE